jgi:hypothetical protein
MTTPRVMTKGTSGPDFDPKALAEEIGATVNEGKVSAARGRYYLTAGSKRFEILVGEVVKLADIKKLIGKTVPVIVSKGVIIAVGNPILPGCYGILCYVPPPDIIREINEMAREAAIDRFAKAGLISSKLAEKFRAASGSLVALRQC